MTLGGDINTYMFDESQSKGFRDQRAGNYEMSQPESTSGAASDNNDTLGLFETGELSFGNNVEWGLGRTGVFMAFPGYKFDANYLYDGDGSLEFHLGGVAEDVLQWGGNASNGLFTFGAGAGTLGASGITIDGETTYNTRKAISFVADNGDIFGEFYTILNSSTVEVNLFSNYDQTQAGGQILIRADDATGGTGRLIINQTNTSELLELSLGDMGSILRAETAGGNTLIFNDDGIDTDIIFETSNITDALFIDAGNDIVEVNADFVFNQGGLNSIDARFETDTKDSALLVDASADSININALHALGRESLNIAGGAITITQSFAVVNAQSGTTDNLDTINGGAVLGTELKLQAAIGDTITVRDGVGNIQCGSNRTLNGTNGSVMRLTFRGGNWYQDSFAAN